MKNVLTLVDNTVKNVYRSFPILNGNLLKYLAKPNNEIKVAIEKEVHAADAAFLREQSSGQKLEDARWAVVAGHGRGAEWRRGGSGRGSRAQQPATDRRRRRQWRGGQRPGVHIGRRISGRSEDRIRGARATPEY